MLKDQIIDTFMMPKTESDTTATLAFLLEIHETKRCTEKEYSFFEVIWSDQPTLQDEQPIKAVKSMLEDPEVSEVN